MLFPGLSQNILYDLPCASLFSLCQLDVSNHSPRGTLRCLGRASVLSDHVEAPLFQTLPVKLLLITENLDVSVPIANITLSTVSCVIGWLQSVEPLLAACCVLYTADSKDSAITKKRKYPNPIQLLDEQENRHNSNYSSKFINYIHVKKCKMEIQWPCHMMSANWVQNKLSKLNSFLQ